jgi:hypothetical protein
MNPQQQNANPVQAHDPHTPMLPLQQPQQLQQAPGT